MTPHPLDPLSADEFHECDAALRADARVIEALAQRGITDMDFDRNPALDVPPSHRHCHTEEAP